MLQQAVNNQVKFDYVLADSWFGAKKNMEFMISQINQVADIIRSGLDK